MENEVLIESKTDSKPHQLIGYPASVWVWGKIWKPDQTNFSKFDVCDVIQFQGQVGIQSWLFTSTDGFVKSKSKQKWSISQIISRIEDATPTLDENSHPAMFLKENSTNCFKITKEGVRQLLDSQEIEFNGAVILSSHLLGGYSLFEQVYQTQPNSFTSKHITFNLIGTKAKGKVSSKRSTSFHSESTGDLPSHRVQSLNKEINTLAKEFTTNLISFLESRSRRKVLSLRMICALENESPLLTGSTQKRVWLHHVLEISFQKKGAMTSSSSSTSSSLTADTLGALGLGGRGGGVGVGGGGGGGADNDIKSKSGLSSWSHGTKVSSLGGGGNRLEKCSGDFCLFSDFKLAFTSPSLQHVIFEDELKSIDPLNSLSHPSSNHYLDWDLKTETQNAIRRHRGDLLNSEGEEVDGSSHPMNLGGPSSDSFSDKNPSSLTPSQGKNNKGDGAERDSFGGMIGFVDLKRPVWKVNMKSVMLAREEMGKIKSQIDSFENSYFEKQQQEQHSSEETSSLPPDMPFDPSLHSPWTAPLFHWWVSEGRFVSDRKGKRGIGLLAGKSSSVSVPSLSSDRIGRAVLSTLDASVQDLGRGAGLGANVSLSEGISRPLHSIDPPSSSSSSSMDPSSSLPLMKAGGQLSWYYSTQSVCERCHHVYSNLDRLREEAQLQSLRDKKRIIEEEESLRGREIERKIFDQRKFVSRIHHQSTSASTASTYAAANNNSTEHSTYSSHPSHSQLPPLPTRVSPSHPWGLTDENQRQTYQSQTESRNSAFVRGIGNKVQRAKEDLSFNGYMYSHQNQASKGPQPSGLSIGERNFSHIEGNEDEEDEEGVGGNQHDSQWSEFIGLKQYQQQQSGTKKRTLKKKKPISTSSQASTGGGEYDASRLLHPWQRDMREIRRQLALGESEPRVEKAKPKLTPLSHTPQYSYSVEDSVLPLPSQGPGPLSAVRLASMRVQSQSAPSLSLPLSQSQSSLHPLKSSSHTLLPSLSDLSPAPFPLPLPLPASTLSFDSQASHTLQKFKQLTANNNTLTPVNKINNNNNPDFKSMNKEISAPTRPPLYPSTNTLPSKGTKTPIPIKHEEEEEDGDDNDDDDDEGEEGIGWSPYVISLSS